MQRIGVWLTAAFAVLALVVGGLTIAPVSATIQVLCKGVTKAQVKVCDPGYASAMSKMHWRMYSGHNCTNYVAYRLGANGVPEPRILMGNARDWAARAKKLKIKVDATPAVGSVGVWPGKNHVTYVAEVGKGYIVTREDNYPGYYPKGIYQKLKIYKGDSSYPKNFIHFKDLVAGAAPKISGTKRVGSTLTAATTKWTPSGLSYRYQWLRDGVAIAGGTKSTYALAAADMGRAISVKVTGKKTGFATLAKTSVKTAAIAEGVLKNTVAPAITGTTKVGEELTVSAGSWKPGGLRYAYQWKRNGVDVAGATAPTYTLTATDLGAKLSATVTGVADGYGPLLLTAASTPAIKAGTLQNPVAPSISGTPQVDVTVRALDGTWSPADATLTRQWLADDKPIKGATDTTYKPVPLDAGRKISVKVTATRAGYTTRSVTSAATVVAPGVLTNTKAPAITGTAGVGKTLTASGGTWSPGGASLAYQWVVKDDASGNDAPIVGATRKTFVPTSAELGKVIAVRVTASQTGYTPSEKTSAPTGPVEVGTLSNTKAPTITGTPRVGSMLKANAGTWSPSGVKVTYRWLRNGGAIPGATAPTYTLTTADRGTAISVEATGAKADYTSVSVTSKPTAVVKSTPRVTVSAKPGKARVTFTIRVSATGVYPTGKVRINDGTTTVRLVTLTNGRATVTLVKQKKGKHTFSFRYAGDAMVAARAVTKKATIN